MNGRRRGITSALLARHAGLVTVCAVVLLPVYIMVVNTFKDEAEILTSPFSLPIGNFSTEGVRRALNGTTFDLWPAALLTAKLTALVVTIEIVLAGMIAYALTRGRSRTLKFVFVLIVSGIFLPPQLLLLPATHVLDELGLMNTLAGLVAYEVTQFMPFAVLLYAGFIRQVPESLDEAAYLDGASMFRVYWSIIFPLLRPATGAVGVIVAVSVWGDFLPPLVILGPFEGNTITVGIYRSIGQYTVDLSTAYALLLLASLPVLVIFWAAQRQLVSGLITGGVKH